MAKNLPALHLFSIFEASARLQSFKLASEELFITPSAVSHQIKALEHAIGLTLFIRKGRGVNLNAAGKMYLDYVQKSLQILEEGTKKLKNRFASPTLKISSFPTMATNVIIPELGMFQNAHPEIDIRIETGLNVADLRYDDFDLAIRIGVGDWPNVKIRKLLDLQIAAVCSPAFADKYQLTQFEQVNDVPLIDLANMDNIWQTWAKVAHVDNINIKHSLTLSNYDATLHAAEQGLGLALALMPIENSLLARKVLVNPFNRTVPFGQSLYAVYREDDKDRHDIQCFLDWLTKSPIFKTP
jgi:LysR family glycine cleavage system transcriptional activator